MGIILRQVWTMSGVLLNMMAGGMSLGYASSLLPALKADDAEIKTDFATASWIASSIGVSLIPGFFSSSYAMHRFGRRMAQILSIVPALFGWLLIYFATTTTELLIGRILCGITAGATVTLGAIVIETKDRTLPEIEYFFNHGKFEDEIKMNDMDAMAKMITDTEMTDIKFQ
ncbi:major facilitator superfamily domain-containing protein [Phthorimaea operculella]|nr:major facilitator superfamily domain-containing protein [Phthorimaea operculella]